MLTRGFDSQENGEHPPPDYPQETLRTPDSHGFSGASTNSYEQRQWRGVGHVNISVPPAKLRRRHDRRSRIWRSQPPTPLMRIALNAAAGGMHVFPCWPFSKFPALHGQRRCDGTGVCAHGHRGWEQRATTDAELIRYWWGAMPSSNVAVACGPSGLYVIDLDGAHGETPPDDWAGARHGADVLARLATRAGEPFPEDTYTVRTPRSGQHLYFRTASALRNTVALAGWRIDSRGHGGLVIAAGSLRRDGAYTVDNDVPIAPLPTWLIPHFTPPLNPHPQQTGFADMAPLPEGRLRRYVDTVTDNVANAAPRTAHNTLFRAAFTLGGLVGDAALDEGVARDALHAAAQRRRIPEYEATEAIADGLRAGRARPLRLR